jgi:ABC-2 type transport system ATP-binding protein
MISCRGITKTFGEFTAVQNVSFEVAPGRICALLGHNGAGKSTLLNMLTGLLAPTSGEAVIADLSVRTQAQAVKQVVGVVPENLGLFNELTIQEHLQTSGPIYGLPAGTTAERSEQLLRVLGLSDVRHTFLNQCSHGMRKKTALAMALLHNPTVVFLDEPFEGIDPVTAETIRLQLKAMAERGLTILLSSHILSMVNRIADQILLLRRGELVWSSEAGELPGSLEELYFDLVQAPSMEDLPWLRSNPS